MAVTEFTDFIRSVHSDYATTVSDGVLEDFVIFKEIERANGAPRSYQGTVVGPGGFWKNAGGNQIEWRVMFDQMDYTTWGPGTNVSVVTPQMLKNPVLTLGGYTLGYFIDRFETMSMNTKEQYIPLIKFYEQMLARRAYSMYETEILKNSTTGGWKGLPAFIAASGTYATNVTLSDTYALPKVFDYSGSGQTFGVTCVDRLFEVVNGATHGDSQGGAHSPSVAFMNRTDWQTMHSVIEDSHRQIDVNTDMLNFGFTNFTYAGVRCYWSDEMALQSINKVYVLNTHHLGIAYASDKLLSTETDKFITGSNVGVVAVSFHKGTPYCSNTRMQGMINNTTSS